MNDKGEKIMIIPLKSEKDVQILLKNETPYNVNGSAGITYRVGVLLDNDVEKIKCASKEVYDAIMVGSAGRLMMQVNVRNGSVSEPRITGFFPTQSSSGK